MDSRWLLAWHLLLTLCLLVGPFPSARLTAQSTSPTPTGLVTPLAVVVNAPANQLEERVDELLAQMTTADRVGQLFIVTFEGRRTSQNSEIAELLQAYRVGGVVMSAANGNFDNAPGSNTALQVATLTNQLQALAYNITLSADAALNPRPEQLVPPEPNLLRLDRPDLSQAVSVPLLIGVQQSGDDLLDMELRQGFTPLPSQLALGAAWQPELAQAVGRIVGQELRAVGVNLLLGPNLDVLEQPRRDNSGNPGAAIFGSDAYWVGKMGQAYIAGVHEGSQGHLLTIARHFPGQGGSDRRPDEEVATIQKTLQELRRTELPPFAIVTAGISSILDPGAGTPGVTDGMMSSHIRYSGFQGSRERTPPISLATELGTILALEEFAPWRQNGGIMMSDELGVPAIRRYYDASLQTFPKRLIALDAFNAGNDLLYLSRFGLGENWEEERFNIKETISFFRERYGSDPDFALRVDAAVRRVLRLKLRIFDQPASPSLDGDFEPTIPLAPNQALDVEKLLVLNSDLLTFSPEAQQERIAIVSQIAREALTVLYPDPQRLSDPLPAPPQPDEQLLIFSDSRTLLECATCFPEPAIDRSALSDIMLRLYGPGATGQLSGEQIASYTFSELNQLLSGAAPRQLNAALESELNSADWLIFAMLNIDLEQYPNSDAVQQFLRQRSDQLRGKRIVVLAFNVPFMLDGTEISKLTAYFGVYGRSAPFLETGVRAIFRGLPVIGAPPVSVPGTRFNSLIEQLEPAPIQVINLAVLVEGVTLTGENGSEEKGENGTQVELQAGDTMTVRAGPILDRNGHPVPDGTPVNFRMIYEGEELALPTEPVATREGMAAIAVPLERSGTLRISASSLEARTSINILVGIQGENLATIATVVPTPTPEPTVTPTAVAPVVPVTSLSEESGPRTYVRVDWITLAIAALTLFIFLGFLLVVLERVMPRRTLVHRLLWAIIGGLATYVLYGLGWFPLAAWMQRSLYPWGVVPVVFVGMLFPLVWFQMARVDDF